MKRFAVVLERGRRNLGAWVPDLLGCVAVGDTLPEMRRMIREAIEFHLEGMGMDGEPIPHPTTSCAVVDAGRPYAALVRKTRLGFSASCPDVEGCVAAAGTRRGAVRLLRELLGSRFGDLRREGKPMPAPASLCEWVEVRPPKPGQHRSGIERTAESLPKHRSASRRARRIRVPA